MKRLAIALILIAAVPALVTASSSLGEEFAGKNEMVAESVPSSDDDRLISSKSSRPRTQRAAESSAKPPVDTRLSANWL